MPTARIQNTHNRRVRVNPRNTRDVRMMATQGGSGIQGEQGVAGIQWKGAFSETTEYSYRDAVFYQGSSYFYKYDEPRSGFYPTNSTYWDVLVEKGDQGDTGSDKTFSYVQNVASNEWHVTHNLEKIPSIIVRDSAGSLIEGDYTYPDLNTAILSFSASFTGKANFN